MPLISARCVDPAALLTLREAAAAAWFHGAPHPEAAMAGLWLRVGGWEQAHSIAQDIHTPEGSYWHAIVHRQEPDAWNSGYWFRRVGRHTIFPALHATASRLAAASPGAAFPAAASWDPEAFVQFCVDRASREGSAAAALALAIQDAEWQLLFQYCARATMEK